jgi:hypothetical protein
MRGAAEIVMLALATTAGAEPPPGLALAGERARFLDGQLGVQLPVGMVMREPEHAELDRGDARLLVEATRLHGVPDGEVHARVAAALSVGVGIKIERLELPGAWPAFAVVPRFPRRTGDRTLICAGYVAAGNGEVEILAFYVDASAFEDAAAWAVVSRRILSTLVAAPSSAGPAPADLRTPAPALQVPAGWQLTGAIGSYRLSARRGTRHCDVRDDELDAHVEADAATATIVGGRLRGHDVYWTVWADRRGVHAESMIGASRWGTFHVVCHADTRRELDKLRSVLEALHAVAPAPPAPMP